MKKIGLGITIVCIFTTIACSAVFSASDKISTLSEQGNPFSRVFVLNPFIVYEDAHNEQNLPIIDPAAQLIFDGMSAQWSTDVFSTIGLANIKPADITSVQMGAIKNSYDLLNKGAEDLVKQWKDKQSYMGAFAALKSVSGADCLLVQFVKVKVGNPGAWDFVCTGAVTPTTSATSIKLVLIDLNTGKIWWSGASIEHDMPDKNIVKNLYKTAYGGFPGYKATKRR